jgi:hypothetical protein
MALVSIAVSLMADAPHYPWQGCQCQRGGERGGHCHCPDNGKMNVYCRYGGNHWICFPFSRRRSLASGESDDYDHHE